MLERIADPKVFERLCADLLHEEGFVVTTEPFVDRDGTDFTAIEEYKAHDRSRSVNVSWRVQCKHYIGSGRRVGRQEMVELLHTYSIGRVPNHGLLIMSSTDYSSGALDALQAFLAAHAGALVHYWNGRQLVSRLERHESLMNRYGLASPQRNYSAALHEVTELSGHKTLLISDQSAMAHDLSQGLRATGCDIVFLPVWNYVSRSRLSLFLDAFKHADFSLVVLFLGDTFGFNVPNALVDFVHQKYQEGTPVLAFPFFAWLLQREPNPKLDEMIPVELLEPGASDEALQQSVFQGEFRKGDFRWLAKFESFAEDRYAEFDPGASSHDICRGAGGRFGLSHSYEFLRPKMGADVALADATGNPLVVCREGRGARCCYINSCCHACLSTIPISSPVDVSPEFAALLRESIRWLVRRTQSGD